MARRDGRLSSRRARLPTHSEPQLQFSRTARIIASALAAAIIVLSLVPPRLRPDTGLPHGLEHFIMYSATGLAFGVGYGRHRLLLVLLVIFSGGVEIAQTLVPGRHARLGDFIIDSLALGIGVVIASLADRIRARICS